MAGAGLTPASLDPAARRVLDGYLAELEAALAGPKPARAAIVAEVADGLTEATAAYQRRGLAPADAASAAAAEFGDAHLVAAGFGAELAAQTGRRVGLGLLATGPLVGLTWLSTVLTNAAAFGQPPPAGLVLVPALFAAVLAVAVPAAVVSVLATGRLARWLPTQSPTGTHRGQAGRGTLHRRRPVIAGRAAGLDGNPRRAGLAAGGHGRDRQRHAAHPGWSGRAPLCRRPPTDRLNSLICRLAMARAISGMPTRLGNSQNAMVGSRFQSGSRGPLST